MTTYRTGVHGIRQQFLAKWLSLERPTRDDNVMIELVGVSFRATEDTIFKKPDYEYIAREIEWYLSGSLNVYDFPDGAPKIWHEVAGYEGQINSNYGNLVFSLHNHRQFDEVVRELEDHPDSRRAIMIYTRPTMHTDAIADGKNDFVCTNTVQYIMREKTLHAVVQMRSNDAVFGYRNDYAWQRFVLEHLVATLSSTYPGLSAGDIIWQVGSLHIYPRHVHLIKRYYETGSIE